MQITFETYGDKQMNFMLEKAADSVKDLKPVFKDIQKDFYQVERKLFANEGAGGSFGSWRPLTPWYADWKSKQGRGETILVLGGNLISSLVNENDKDAIANISDTSMELGTKNPLGQIHYTGTTKMPSRKPIDLGSEDKWRWLKMIQYFIRDALRANR